MQQHPHVAVALLNYNGRNHLEKYLPTVLSLTYPNLSVWVIDNASTDDSVSFLQQQYPQVQLVVNPLNGGFAQGYNMGLRHIESPYIFLLNTDVAVTPNLLQPLVDSMEKNAGMAAIQPRICADTNRHYFEYAGAAGGYMDILGYPFCRGRLFESVEKDEGQYNDEQLVFWASGAAMLMRKKLFDDAGGFYPYFFMHNEEIDWCWRMLNKGYKIGYNGHEVVYHLGGGSLAKENPRKTWFNFRNNLIMISRNMPLGWLFLLLPLRFGLDIVAALQMLLAGNNSNALAVMKAWVAYVNWLVKPGNHKWPGNRKSFAGPGRYSGSVVWQHFVKKHQRAADFYNGY
ncbi:glycosyltransferase family 2 protein [Phnomibacter sp. MR]|uniref:glycosyltransferase family 2 protein n=1 Tax=Phnomibacter sp. MR TaxID=3042318 RepID=UPI003A804944